MRNLPKAALRALEAGQYDLVAVVGPTGSGKSRLALTLAENFDAEIINCDSRQVYRDFPIITAQPDQIEQRVCPHHLYGFLESGAGMTAGFFRALAEEKIAGATAGKRTPVLAGGTGLYLRALLYGLPDIPPVSEEIRHGLREELKRFGSPRLYERLAALDSDYAAAVHPNNSRHIMRALEVCEGTGRPFTWWHKQHVRKRKKGILLLGLSLAAEEKERILGGRIEEMLSKGALEEARAAWEDCPDAAAPGWSGIGCAELAAWLEGRLNLGQAISQWLSHTKTYAKRQMTWFKAEDGILWL